MEKQTPLRAARVAKGMTLTALAEALKVDTGHLSRVERGGNCSPDLAEKIVTVVGAELLHEMQVLYPDRFVGKKIGVAKQTKAPPHRIKVGDFLYALIGSA